jgi:iron complex transport system substrate-binding protein
MLAGLVGREAEGQRLVDDLEAGLQRIRESAERFTERPRVFFEEWDDPLISGIQWVEELIELSGGQPIFPELRHCRLARDRVVEPDEVVRRNPHVIIASWCGKAMRRNTIVGRPGWDRTRAVQDEHIYEIKSTYILQPGPAALTEGVRQLHTLLSRVVASDA